MSGRIPAIVNVASGSAEVAREALAASGAFDVHKVQPTEIASTVKKLVTGGARRILVAGGDGTIRAAAEQLLETPAELAVLPGGTLNHFAKDLGISTVSADAVELALGEARPDVDVGAVRSWRRPLVTAWPPCSPRFASSSPFA
jgi:diacylglycerol kinase family enzyme